MSKDNINKLNFDEKLKQKILSYLRSIWSGKIIYPEIEEWLNNFNSLDYEENKSEKINMLYLLSKFSYFGEKEINVLLESLYIDLFKQKEINSIRKCLGNIMDLPKISEEYEKVLKKTFFCQSELLIKVEVT